MFQQTTRTMAYRFHATSLAPIYHGFCLHTCLFFLCFVIDFSMFACRRVSSSDTSLVFFYLPTFQSIDISGSIAFHPLSLASVHSFDSLTAHRPTGQPSGVPYPTQHGEPFTTIDSVDSINFLSRRSPRPLTPKGGYMHIYEHLHMWHIHMCMCLSLCDVFSYIYCQGYTRTRMYRS